ncbi:MAG: hypothetical protein ABJI96_12070 [Paracoccaceae bacterium]
MESFAQQDKVVEHKVGRPNKVCVRAWRIEDILKIGECVFVVDANRFVREG